MKVCPQCRAEYQDPALNFCLEDGSALQPKTAAAPPTGQITFGAPSAATPPPTSGLGQAGGQQGFTMQPPPKRASNWWMWLVIGVLATVVLCGGGLIGLGLIMNSMDSANSNKNGSTDAGSKDSRVYTTVDFSDYVFGDSTYAEMVKDGETMTANTKGLTKSFVLTLPDGKFDVHGGGATITVKNSGGDGSTSGYGMVFHSTGGPREKDYFFVIDSVRQEYRVSQDVNRFEKDIVKWKSSSAIKSGSEENILEVEDKAGTLTFSINGTQVEQLPDKIGTAGGTIGVYFSEPKVVFSSFKVWR